jgi:hypothetical protein
MAKSLDNSRQGFDPNKVFTVQYPTISSGFFLLLLALVLVQFTDAFMTQVYVGGGLVQEGNPLMAGLIFSGHFVTVKIMAMSISSLAFWCIHDRFPVIAKSAASTLVLFYCFVLWANTSVVF